MSIGVLAVSLHVVACVGDGIFEVIEKVSVVAEAGENADLSEY